MCYDLKRNIFTFSTNNSDNKPNKIKICDDYVQINNLISDVKWSEINDDLFIEDSKNSFWHTIEYEMKIDIYHNSIEELLSNLKAELLEYDSSKIYFLNSFEHCYEATDGNLRVYYVILGKKNFKKKKAIKVKEINDRLGRKVSILEYSQQNINSFLKSCFSNKFKTKSYPAFYKKKYRCILVHKINGSVYGLSISKTNFLKKSLQNKVEIEIEYWSNIMPVNQSHKFDKENLKEMEDILKIIIIYLRKHNIKYKYPGVRKSEWFKANY